MKKKGPRVSVIMPVYNCEKYLSQAINSILSQTYKDFEFLIIDDGSTDRSLAIIKKYAKIDNRIIYKARENRGLPATLNELISMSRGDFLARMDGDDISKPNRLQKQMAYMENHPEIAILGTKVKKIGQRQYGFYEKVSCDEVHSIRLLFRNAGVSHPTALIRRKFLMDNGIWYDESNVGSEDYALWIDVVIAGGIIHSLDTPLLYYRMHENQMTTLHYVEGRDGIAKAVKRLLNQYGDYNAREIDVLINFFEASKDIDIRLAHRVLNKLIKQNKEKKIHDEKLFHNEIAFQWVSRYLLRIKYRKISNPLKDYMVRHSIVKIADLPYIISNIWKVSAFNRYTLQG